MGTQVIRNVRPLGAAAVDVVLDRAAIEAIVPAGSAPAQLPLLVDGGGQLLLPALVESHVHFDKTLWGMPWRPNTAGPTRNDRIANEQRLLPGIDVPIAERAGPLIEHCIARGSLCFRSHVDAQTAFGIRHVEAMLALRETYRHVIDLQFVAFPQAGMLISPGTSDLMRAALELGVDIVGGIDPAGIDRDPIGHLEAVFAMATRYGKGIDIHLHDPGELGRWQIERIADMTQAAGLAGRVMISHAYCLGAFPPADLAPLADRLAELRHLDHDLRAAAHHGASRRVAAQPRRQRVLRLRRHPGCVEPDGQRRHAGARDADRAALRLEQGRRARDGLRHRQRGRRAGARHRVPTVLPPDAAPISCCSPRKTSPRPSWTARPARTVISRGRVVARDGAYIGH